MSCNAHFFICDFANWEKMNLLRQFSLGFSHFPTLFLILRHVDFLSMKYI